MKALVTGAARGLGLATARRLASDGARVALLDRDPLVEEVAAALDPRAAAVEPMRAGEGPASIVNISSVLGVRGEPNGAPYCVSKAGLRMLTEVLALELAPAGIRVNAIAPGAIETDMHFDHLREIAAADGTTFDEEPARVRAGIPIGRHGTPDDVAATVAWLTSADAGYVTGQTILVDGGGMDR